MGMIADSMVDEWDSSLPKTDGIYRLIEKTTDSRSSKVRIWAITALGNSGDPRAVRSLIDCCQDKSPEIRLRAIEGLQSLRSGRAVGVLIERIRDKEELPETRQRAAAALATIRSFSAIRELKNRHADPDEDGTLRTFIGGELDRVYLW
jgi:HEAT repeat protein